MSLRPRFEKLAGESRAGIREVSAREAAEQQATKALLIDVGYSNVRTGRRLRIVERGRSTDGDLTAIPRPLWPGPGANST